MASVKQLAGQTMWYGISSVGAKFLNYLQTPLLTYLMGDLSGQVDFGNTSLLYSYFGVFNILFTYGMETAYFRFSNKDGYDKNNIYQTAFSSLFFSTILLCFALWCFRSPIEHFINLGGHPEYITLCVWIIALDTIAAIPFARLRQENRPKRYAFIRVMGILLNLLFTILFIVYLPKIAHQAGGRFESWYNGNTRVGLILLANLIQNLFVFLALSPQWRKVKIHIDRHTWKQLVNYGSPMVIIGLAGMINEVVDRQMLSKWYPGSDVDAKRIVALYSANYKISIVVTMFIQAFRMAAEPFFFNQARDKHAPALYGNIMKWFVITVSLAFLCTALFLNIWQYFEGATYRSGIGIVPILLLANICNGIYYNLSVWYKLTDRMRTGMWITIMGAIITFTGNYLFIPTYGMYASAWTTLVCYFTMMVVCYLIGQKYFPINYHVKKLAAYLTVMLALFVMQRLITAIIDKLGLPAKFMTETITGALLLFVYLALIAKVEKKELQNMPVIGKFLKR